MYQKAALLTHALNLDTHFVSVLLNRTVYFKGAQGEKFSKTISAHVQKFGTSEYTFRKKIQSKSHSKVATKSTRNS